MKKYIILSILINIFIHINVDGQSLWDTTFVVDSKLNCISPFDSLRSPSEIFVGIPLHTINYSFISYWIYLVTVTGEVSLDQSGRKSKGPVISYVDDKWGYDETTFTLVPGDSFEFVPGEIDNFYFLAYIFDPDSIPDNQGQFIINCKAIGWLGIENNKNVNSPVNFHLYPNYPNPFNSSTTIHFSLLYPTFVEINIYNSIGQKIKTLIKSIEFIGSHKIQWDGTTDSGTIANSGIYFCRILTNNQLKTQRLLLIK